jgi:hypothetical protein
MPEGRITSSHVSDGRPIRRGISSLVTTLGRLRPSGARGERPCRICLLIRAPNSIGAERDSVSGRGRGMEDSDGPPPDISLTD